MTRADFPRPPRSRTKSNPRVSAPKQNTRSPLKLSTEDLLSRVAELSLWSAGLNRDGYLREYLSQKHLQRPRPGRYSAVSRILDGSAVGFIRMPDLMARYFANGAIPGSNKA